MLQELVNGPSLVHCFLQTFLDEVTVIGGEFTLGESVRVFGGDEIHGLEWRHS